MRRASVIIQCGSCWWTGLLSHHGSVGQRVSLCVGSLQHQVRCAAEGKLARQYMMELHRARADFKRMQTKRQQEESLRMITATSLRDVKGLDSRVVSQCLSTLVALSAPPDLPLVEECAAWVRMNGSDMIANGITIVQTLHSLKVLRFDDVASVTAAVSDALRSVVRNMPVSSVCLLLDVLLSHSTANGQLLTVAMNTVRQCTDELALAEKVSLVSALGKWWAGRSGGNVGADENNDMDLVPQLSGALWLGIVGGDLDALSTADLTTLLCSTGGAPCDIRPAVREKVEQEFLRRAERSLQDAGDAGVSLPECLLLAEVNKIHAQETPQIIRDMAKSLVERAFAREERLLTTEFAAKLYDAYEVHQPQSAPPAVERYLVKSINEGRSSWTPEAVETVLRHFRRRPERGADADVLAETHLELLRRKAVAGMPIDAREIASIFTEDIVAKNAEGLAMVISNNIQRWSFPQTLHYIEAAARIPTNDARAVLRDIGSRLVPLVATASIQQLATLMRCYGAARVRNEGLCQAITDRAALFVGDIDSRVASCILGGFASVEYRNTKLFTDFAPLVINDAPRAAPSEVASLLAAYAKMLIWDFRVIWQLAARAAKVCDAFTLTEMIAVLCALNRMDVVHEPLTEAVVARVQNNDMALLRETPVCQVVALLSALVRAGVRHVPMFTLMADQATEGGDALTAAELGELLLSLTRARMEDHQAFAALLLRAVALVPTCPSMAMGHILTAYAAAGTPHDELFSIVADRVVSNKDLIPAVTIATILSAFAVAGVKNDRLFIEVIPRVRHVAHYGTPRDIANVVTAYATVGLWHYKLFVRLADRTVSLRGECRCAELAEILSAYARVGMRYEKLFVDMSPRVQTVAHLLEPNEIAAIVHAYVHLDFHDEHVLRACATRAVEIADRFSRDDARQTLDALRQVPFTHEGLLPALLRVHPDLNSTGAGVTEGARNDAEGAGTH